MKALQLPFLRSWSRLWPLAFLLLLAGPAAHAQVVDDSTKVLYGPKTTRLIYEAEVLRDSTSGTPLDTMLTKSPQARFWFHDTTFQQDLGTVGSASRPLLYQPNLELGARFGRNVFDKYARDARTVPYYDSRSPYSFFRVVQSGEGEQVFEISYSRSLKKNFSVGVAYERIASNKVVGTNKSRDGLVEHSNLLFFGRYQNENERYHLLFNFSNVRHRALEQGGIKPLDGENTPQDLFKYREQQVWLTQAANNEDRDEFYLTQTYRLLGRGLTVYHTFDAKRQYNNFADLNLETPRSDGTLERTFFPSSFNSPTATIDRAEYRQVENTVGVLGRTKAVEYRLYARDREASLVSQTLLTGSTTANLMLRQPVPSRLFNQFFVGGTAAFNYRTIYAVETAGEVYLLPVRGLNSDNFKPEYWFRGNVRTGPLSAEALVNSYSPTLTQQEFVGNHYAWSHWSGNYTSPATNAVDAPFDKNTNTKQLTGRLQLKLPSLGLLASQRFEASVSAVNIANLVYYGTAGAPQQLGTNRNIVIAFARHRAMLGRVGFDNQATFTKGGNDTEGLRIPSLVTNSRVFYESYIFRKALFNQIGAEVYYQSAFRGYTYNPTAQQFYQQDHFTIGAHAIADVFFVADIKAVSLFLKMAYVNQSLTYDGYYASPFYTGYPRRFQFGLKWNFFN
ncbi:hypothetical protein ACVWYF_000072 [Hymenobacter sp. UYAg731]